MEDEIRISEKPFLTLKEASLFFNIGINKMKQLTDEHSEFIVLNGNRRLIKRFKLEQYLNENYSI